MRVFVILACIALTSAIRISKSLEDSKEINGIDKSKYLQKRAHHEFCVEVRSDSPSVRIVDCRIKEPIRTPKLEPKDQTLDNAVRRETPETKDYQLPNGLFEKLKYISRAIKVREDRENEDHH